MNITTEAFAVIDKKAKAQGNGACVLVPKEWTGKTVRIILIEKNGEIAMPLPNSSPLKKELWNTYIKNAIKEMESVSQRASDYAEELKNTDLDVDQKALIKNFSREFDYMFSEVEIKK